ncbi:hypothetical protein HZA38_04225 [Candidatus Peregrinibacteria bacterium]|nr:hypothetical protein [Candidatus Peregrinibacteria bacterium]
MVAVSDHHFSMELSWKSISENLRMQAQSGSILLLAAIAVSAMSLTTISLGYLVMGTSESGEELERATEGFFALDTVLEMSLYDATVHGEGYRVASEDYSAVAFGARDQGASDWELKSQAHIVVAGETIYTTVPSYNTVPPRPIQFMVYPSEGLGDSLKDPNWNSIPSGGKNVVPLYVDNTGKPLP